MKLEISGGVNVRSPRRTRMTLPGSPPSLKGSHCSSPLASSMPRPMNRLTEYTERAASESSRRCASRPTWIAPDSPTDTTDGSSRSPDSSAMTVVAPSRRTATRLFVVPRSMPTTLLMFARSRRRPRGA
ncbi:MAG TPA: hypothetical protein PLT35_02405 [Vicinamibacterales bacterium]|nr:hypothetical protein [Vicinamibacterales bacterium]